MKVLLILLALTLTGCESLKLRNAAKTTATTAITYIAAGPIPAVLNFGASVLVDETLPPENTINDVKTKEQMWAFIVKELFVYALYSIIALLAFTSVIGPWAADRRRKRKMKYDALRDEVKAHRLQGLNVKKEETDGR
jgi:ABC-type uncharacterized transport system permease subunit